MNLPQITWIDKKYGGRSFWPPSGKLEWSNEKKTREKADGKRGNKGTTFVTQIAREGIKFISEPAHQE